MRTACTSRVLSLGMRRMPRSVSMTSGSRRGTRFRHSGRSISPHISADLHVTHRSTACARGHESSAGDMRQNWYSRNCRIVSRTLQMWSAKSRDVNWRQPSMRFLKHFPLLTGMCSSAGTGIWIRCATSRKRRMPVKAGSNPSCSASERN